MTFEFRCLNKPARFSLDLRPSGHDVLCQPCRGCDCDAIDGQHNRVFSPFNFNMGPEPYRPGTPNKYTDEVHETQRDYEKHLDDNQLELRRD